MILYHGTKFENMLSILSEGLEPRNMERGTYFANTSQYAAAFMNLYGVQDIVVFAVDADDLDPDLLEEGVDHNPIFFPDDLEVWLYRGHIEPDLIDEEQILRYDMRQSGSG